MTIFAHINQIKIRQKHLSGRAGSCDLARTLTPAVYHVMGSTGFIHIVFFLSFPIHFSSLPLLHRPRPSRLPRRHYPAAVVASSTAARALPGDRALSPQRPRDPSPTVVQASPPPGSTLTGLEGLGGGKPARRWGWQKGDIRVPAA